MTRLAGMLAAMTMLGCGNAQPSGDDGADGAQGGASTDAGEGAGSGDSASTLASGDVEGGTEDGPGTTGDGPPSTDEGADGDASTGEPLPPPPPPAACGDSELLSLVETLEPGEFGTLDTVGLTADLMDAGSGHWITQYTFKAVFDPTWCRILFTGGGHLSLVKFVTYDIATNAWTHEDNPNWWCDPYDDRNYIWDCVGHAYGHNAIDVAGGRYFYKHGSVWATEVAGNFATEWTQLPDSPGDNFFTSLDYFPELGGLVLVDYTNNGLQVLYDGDPAWTPIAGPFPMGAYHIYSVYNPVEQVMLFGSGNGSADFQVLRADGSVDAVADSPRQFHPSPGDPSTLRLLVADPVSGEFLAASPSGDLFAFDLGTDTWTDTGTTLPEGLEFAAPVADYGVVVFVSGRNQQVVVYRHAPTAG